MLLHTHHNQDAIAVWGDYWALAHRRRQLTSPSAQNMSVMNPLAVSGHSFCILGHLYDTCHDNSSTPAPALQTLGAASADDHGVGLCSLLHMHAAVLKAWLYGGMLAALSAADRCYLLSHVPEGRCSKLV